MRRLLVVLLLAVGFVPVAGGTAWACSCGGWDSEAALYRDEADNAREIYLGLVTAADPPSPRPDTPGSTTYTVRVEESLKGSAAGERTVMASNSGVSCGIVLQTGKRALLFEHGDPARVGGCGGSTQHDVDRKAGLVRAALLEQLADTGSPPGLAALAAVVVVVGFAVRNRIGRRCVVPA